MYSHTPTHDVYENTWKCGERIEFFLPPSAGGQKRIILKKSRCLFADGRLDALAFCFPESVGVREVRRVVRTTLNTKDSTEDFEARFSFIFLFFLFSHTSTSQLQDKPWSQVSSILPPGSFLYFLSRIGFSNPTARRFSIECCSLTLLRFPQVNLYARQSPHEFIRVCTRLDSNTRSCILLFSH